jgi:hypothetical protein
MIEGERIHYYQERHRELRMEDGYYISYFGELAALEYSGPMCLQGKLREVRP